MLNNSLYTPSFPFEILTLKFGDRGRNVLQSITNRLFSSDINKKQRSILVESCNTVIQCNTLTYCTIIYYLLYFMYYNILFSLTLCIKKITKVDVLQRITVLQFTTNSRSEKH